MMRGARTSREARLTYHGSVSSKAVAAVTSQGLSAAAAEPVGLDTEQDIDLLLAFLNTTDAEARTDLLDDPAQWQQWCWEYTLQAPTDASAAREIRDTLRNSLNWGDLGSPTVAHALAEWPVRARLDGGIPVISGDDAVGSVLVAAARVVTTGHWHRIKICPATDCLWAFYDRSRNRSRTWCSMRVCGNREKARSWRERHTTQ